MKQQQQQLKEIEIYYKSSNTKFDHHVQIQNDNDIKLYMDAINKLTFNNLSSYSNNNEILITYEGIQIKYIGNYLCDQDNQLYSLFASTTTTSTNDNNQQYHAKVYISNNLLTTQHTDTQYYLMKDFKWSLSLQLNNVQYLYDNPNINFNNFPNHI